jgi:hypothetical protein
MNDRRHAHKATPTAARPIASLPSHSPRPITRRSPPPAPSSPPAHHHVHPFTNSPIRATHLWHSRYKGRLLTERRQRGVALGAYCGERGQRRSGPPGLPSSERGQGDNVTFKATRAAGSNACCDVRIDAEARADEPPVVTCSTCLRSVQAAEGNRDDMIVSWRSRRRVRRRPARLGTAGRISSDVSAGYSTHFENDPSTNRAP